MNADIYFGEMAGVEVRAYRDGILVAGWYDDQVRIEGGFVTWEELDALRKKASKRVSYGVAQ